MKALIVDDEKHVREAIRLLVDWEALGILEVMEASDGVKAMILIEQRQPEIVFTDMIMPGKNGMELLEWIHHNQPRTKVIVISGHDDFEFVRHTIKYSGIDYLLKPIEPAKLQEAVSYAVQARRHEDQAMELNRQQSMEVNQFKPIYWDSMFSQLLSDPPYYSKIADTLQREFSFPRYTNECRVAVLNLEMISQVIRDKFAAGLDLLFFSILNICNEYLRLGQNGFAFRHRNSEKEIVLLLWRDLRASPRLLAQINSGTYQTLGGRIDFGLGSIQAFPTGLHYSFTEAASALRQANLLLRSNWIHTNYSPQIGQIKALNFNDYVDRLRVAVRSRSEEQLKLAIAYWFDRIQQLDYINWEQVKLWEHEFNSACAEWLLELTPNHVEENQALINQKPLKIPLNQEASLSIALWRKQWTESFSNIMKYVKQHGYQNQHIIFEVEKYLQSHYNQDITLQDIAERFFLSREYISRRFKQEFNENLSDYLTRVRMEKAKQLLNHSSLRISEISEIVGFNDEKYFSKVFKKMTGTSPNEFRKRKSSP